MDLVEYFKDPLKVRNLYHRLAFGWGIAGMVEGVATIVGTTGINTTAGLIQLGLYGVVSVWMYLEMHADSTGKPFVSNFGVFLRYLLAAMAALAALADFWRVHSNTGGAALIFLLFLVADIVIVFFTVKEIRKQGLYKEHFKQAMNFAEEFTGKKPTNPGKTTQPNNDPNSRTF